MKKLLVIFLFIAAVSCKKDKDDNNSHQTRIDLITDRPWAIVFRGYDTNADGSLEIEGYSENFLADCQLDDTFKFDMNETYTMQPNTNTNGCGVGPYTSTWSLHSNGTGFSFDELEGVIITLNDSTFHFKLTDQDGEENHLIFER